ncbi:MAG: hypothetical protein AAF515_00025 [Pseudomonadota bacterium]
MRHFVQFVVPTLIFLFLLYAVSRRRRAGADDGDSPISNTTFLLSLVIGAGFTVALLFGLAQL